MNDCSYITIIDNEGCVYIINKNYIQLIDIADNNITIQLADGSDIFLGFNKHLGDKVLASKLHNYILGKLEWQEHETLDYDELKEMIVKC